MGGAWCCRSSSGWGRVRPVEPTSPALPGGIWEKGRCCLHCSVHLRVHAHLRIGFSHLWCCVADNWCCSKASPCLSVTLCSLGCSFHVILLPLQILGGSHACLLSIFSRDIRLCHRTNKLRLNATYCSNSIKAPLT